MRLLQEKTTLLTLPPESLMQDFVGKQCLADKPNIHVPPPQPNVWHLGQVPHFEVTVTPQC